MEFRTIVERVLHEDSVEGGAGSVFGAGVASTATPFSGDNYAKGDARNLFGGPPPTILTRNGTIGGKRKKKKFSYKKAAKKKSKKKSKK
jgi:hypothetical protein